VDLKLAKKYADFLQHFAPSFFLLLILQQGQRGVLNSRGISLKQHNIAQTRITYSQEELTQVLCG